MRPEQTTLTGSQARPVECQYEYDCKNQVMYEIEEMHYDGTAQVVNRMLACEECTKESYAPSYRDIDDARKLKAGERWTADFRTAPEENE